MRRGDGDATAVFVSDYGLRIRRRVRGKLTPAMRRLFDSQDILSTVGRRLHGYVSTGRLTASTEGELWSFVYRVAECAIIDRRRALSRLRAAEDQDGPVAQAILSRIRSAGHGGTAAEVELDRIVATLDDPTDRTVLCLWLNDAPHDVVVEATGLSSDAVYKRWDRIKARLRKALEEEDR